MKFRTTIITSFAVLAFSGVSVWASVESIDEKQVLTTMEEQGLYHPNEPVVLPESDSRAAIPLELIEEMEAQPEPLVDKRPKAQGI